METENKTKERENKHYGHAVRRLRQDRRLSQKELGRKIGMTQPTVCRYEEQPFFEEEILQLFAKGLEVSVDLIKEMEEDKSLTYYIENNVISANEKSEIIMSNNGVIIHQSESIVLEIIERMQQCNIQHWSLVKEKIAFLEKELSRLRDK